MAVTDLPPHVDPHDSSLPTGGEALVRWLESEGVEVIFGCCGHGNIGFLDALIDSSIAFVSCPHEQIAVHAADAYFRATHKIGVVTTTIGPGVGNVLNGVMDAAQDCSSVLLIAGDTIRDYEGTDSFQEVMRWGDASQSDIFRPVVKRSFRVRHPHMLLRSAARAMSYATTESPGPVILNVALDLFTYRGDFGRDEDFHRRRPTNARVPAPSDEIGRTLELISEAQRPVIYSGGGVLLSEATSTLVEFAERFSIPVATSMMGQSGFPNSHPLYAGNSGSVGTPTAAWALNEADLMIALGTRFGELDTNSWLSAHFVPADCRVVQIDISPVEVGKAFPVDVGIVGDVETVLAQVLSRAGAEPAPESARAAELRARRRDWRQEYEQAAKAESMPYQLESLLADVQDVLPNEALILAGSGIRHQIGQYYTFDVPRTNFVASGHATMGWVTAAAIGAKVGQPDVPVVALAGDGDFRSLSESVGVAVEAGVAPIWVVLNNASYNVIGMYQGRHYGRFIGTYFAIDGQEAGSYSPDYAAMAESYGAVGLRADDRQSFRAALVTALGSARPVVIDVPVTDRPRYRASGFWDANRYLKRGWNLEDAE